MLCRLKLASHPASHNYPMDMMELCANLVNMCAPLAFSGEVTNSSQQPLVEFSIWSFGCFT